MDKFRKKPVVIEALHFTSIQAFNEAVAWPEHWTYLHDDERPFARLASRVKWGGDTAIIPTLEGEMRAGFGDWIIRGVKGEFYPCKSDIFEATYEPVEGE